MPIYDLTHTLLIWFSLWKIKYMNYLSKQDGSHKSGFFCYIHQGPLYGKKCTGKNINRLGWLVYDLTHLTVYEKEQGLLPHLIFLTPFLNFFCNDIHHWHGLSQFNSKVFRYFNLCSAVSVNEHSHCFCIIWCDIPLPLVFSPHGDTIGKMEKSWLSGYRRHAFSSKF